MAASFFRPSGVSLRSWRASSLSARHFVLAAALLHVTLAIGIFIVGRAQLAPGFIDRDGFIQSFANDDYDYQRIATKQAVMLQQGQLIAWVKRPSPFHVKIISIPFAILGPIFGYGTLSAEPFNLLCYCALVGLVFWLGQELFDRRVTLLATATVALWPSLLLHSLQLLKDPLFLAGAIALIFCLVTLFTRVYSWRTAARVAAFVAVIVTLLSFVRVSFAVVFGAVLLLSALLVVVRQGLERQRLFWNLVCLVPALVIIGIIAVFHATHVSERFKHYPSDESGLAKTTPGTSLRITGTVLSLPRIEKRDALGKSKHLSAWLDANARRIGSVRTKFNASYPDAGSVLDRDQDFRSAKDLLVYLPRALEVGLFAPFPNSWLSSGRRVGNAGKILSGAETLLIYLFELLAVFAVMRSPRNLAMWLLLIFILVGVTALGVVVPNIGALYRLRYTFWILLIVLGSKGLLELITLVRLRRVKTV